MSDARTTLLLQLLYDAETPLSGVVEVKPTGSGIFRAEGAPLVVPLRYEITSNNAAFNREVVLAGLGMGLLPLALVEDDLREGRLVRLLGDHEILDTAAEVRLAYMSRTMVPARVRAFIDHAVAYFEEK